MFSLQLTTHVLTCETIHERFVATTSLDEDIVKLKHLPSRGSDTFIFHHVASAELSLLFLPGDWRICNWMEWLGDVNYRCCD